MFKLNNCRWRMALAVIVALSIGFSSQAAEIDQIGTPESTAILTVGQVVKSAPGIECIKKNKIQTELQTKLTSKIEETLKEEERAEELLASIIFCEAGNQSFTGQVAVGAVVLNRMANEAYPDTMEEVIYQPGSSARQEADGWTECVVRMDIRNRLCRRRKQHLPERIRSVTACILTREDMAIRLVHIIFIKLMQRDRWHMIFRIV